MNIFDITNGIYKKEPLIIDKIDVSLCIVLTNILKLNKTNIHSIKKIIHYLFFIEPKRYIMLLFIMIPQNLRPPFIKGVKKIEEVKEDLLYKRIGYQFDWSNRELELNRKILDKVIDKDYFKKELGVK
jgi:hypothetical protein